jgi:hypothetical protein
VSNEALLRVSLLFKGGIQARNAVLPKIELSFEIGKLCSEVDITIIDRLEALFNPRPLYSTQSSATHSRMFKSLNPTSIVSITLMRCKIKKDHKITNLTHVYYLESTCCIYTGHGRGTYIRAAVKHCFDMPKTNNNVKVWCYKGADHILLMLTILVS